jgi:methionyl-tRNA formyltransferase
MLSNLIIGTKDANCKIVGVFRYERQKYCTIYRKLKDFFFPSKEYSYIKSYNIPEIKSKRANSEQFKKELLKLNPDIVIVGTWAEKLKKEIIQLPKIAMINVHPSLLPKYRGPNPYLQTILHNEEHSGLTFHLMTEDYDAGAILLQKIIEIKSNDTGKELRERTVLEARSAVTELLNRLADDFIIPVEQNPEKATYFPQTTQDDVMLNFSEPAKNVVARIKALHPWSKTYFEHKNIFFSPNPYKLEILDNNTNKKDFGEIVEKNCKEKSLTIVCGDEKLLKMTNVSIYGFFNNLFTSFYIKNKVKIGDFIK